MFSIFSYTFPLLYLLEEVSVQTLFLKSYFHFVELKTSMYILKHVLYQICEFTIISPSSGLSSFTDLPVFINEQYTFLERKMKKF